MGCPRGKGVRGSLFIQATYGTLISTSKLNANASREKKNPNKLTEYCSACAVGTWYTNTDQLDGNHARSKKKKKKKRWESRSTWRERRLPAAALPSFSLQGLTGNANLAEPLDTGQALSHVIQAHSFPSVVFLTYRCINEAAKWFPTPSYPVLLEVSYAMVFFFAKQESDTSCTKLEISSWHVLYY
jgi:hypothetical protein